MNANVDNPAELYAHYQAKLDVLHDRLQRYKADPDDKAIHDVRTAIRRLDITYKALPDAARGDAVRHFHHQLKQFFRQNSQIRDGDVMAARLQRLGLPAESPLMKSLQDNRDEQVSAARALAGRLTDELPPPVWPEDVSDSDNFHATLKMLAERFLSLLPVVLRDESKVDEVHGMRKAAKKIFYLLELDPRPASMQLIVNIRLFQKLAGDIHDCDVLVHFLARHREQDPAVDAILDQEKAQRHIYYLQLCGLLGDAAWAQLAHIG